MGSSIKIDFGNDLHTLALDAQLVSFSHGGEYGIRVYVNAGVTDLNNAAIIGLSLKVDTKEVAFVTPIPSLYITHYRDARISGSQFASMTGVTPAPSTAPKKLVIPKIFQ